MSRLSERSRIFAPIGWRYRSLSRSESSLRAHSGWVTKRTDFVPQSKVQSVSVDQGPWQRKLQLATVSVHTPDGPVSVEIRNLDAELAAILVREETDQARRAASPMAVPATIAAGTTDEETASGSTAADV